MSADAELLRWLLAAGTPSVRYLALTDLAGLPADDPDVMTARSAIVAVGPASEILAGQTSEGNWSGERTYYTPKYTSTHWSLLLLSELAVPGNDERFRRGIDYMLRATERELKEDLAGGHHKLSCFWGNLLRYAVHGGYAGDPRLGPVIQHLAGDAIEAGWRCSSNCGLPCAWGAARALWGLAALPAALRPPEAETIIASGTSLLLESYHLADADYPAPERIHPMWFRLNFPLFYQADILFVLRVLAELKLLDHPGTRAALAWLNAQRRAGGTWRGASPFRRRTWAALGSPEETDRWASLQAALVLKAAGIELPGLA